MKTKVKFRETFREKNEIENFRPHPDEICCKITSFHADPTPSQYF
jgi:hypothetical protein